MNLNLTMLGQAISFAIFVWFCMRYVWPPIIDALAKRESAYPDGLAAAEKAKHGSGLRRGRGSRNCCRKGVRRPGVHLSGREASRRHGRRGQGAGSRRSRAHRCRGAGRRSSRSAIKCARSFRKDRSLLARHPRC